MNGVAIVPAVPSRAKVHTEGPRRRHAVCRFPASAELPGIHAPEGIFRDAPALKGLGVLAPPADDAPARMDRFQGACYAWLVWDESREKGRLNFFDWKEGEPTKRKPAGHGAPRADFTFTGQTRIPKMTTSPGKQGRDKFDEPP
jgi:hypothetical protein